MTVSAAPVPDTEVSAVPSEPVWRLTVSQYHDMIQHGILTEDDPVELLEGWLIQKMSKNPPHRVSTRRARERLSRALPAGWYVDAQEPITTLDSEPEPDVIVVRGDSDDYADRHPSPGDVALVVEVADASLHRDRTIKKRAYARAGIALYWIVNLIDRRVEVYSGPSGPSDQPDYRQRSEHGEGDTLVLLLDGRSASEVPVRDLLPPTRG
jgi:Uma2 family endonuclease